ncbi:HD-GYP domain-containing protein [sulfur-oxidizing endosymbiont of Gigantopelta aegis]|uniref:HD-GYP domain-containing protein n=1 Tax=sulfur-oxidizing endosymbiont of Gigantopelta aegis TaxID=2794934 RepID=UPI001FEBE3A9|nr:HD domain-containing phosphohydrolase [sulfur-oxidizing endosymbiont of Gigantopelta aegis]
MNLLFIFIVLEDLHPIGYDILHRCEAPVFSMAAEIALSHHEKWDGSGYPNHLQANAIPESARIVALVDVFDALTMKRPYKEDWTIEESMAEIRRCSGSHFDPNLVDLFEMMLPDICKIKNEWEHKESMNDMD